MIELNPIQRVAFEMIQSDARFIYTMTMIHQNEKSINSNYVMMCQPYLGIFADGAEQWGRKVGMSNPRFTEEEKSYYCSLRKSHKLYELSYLDYQSTLVDKFNQSDDFFRSIRSPLEKITGYYNVGTDICEGEFCGNSILCALYTPVEIFNNDIGPWIKDISIVAGKLVVYFGGTDYKPYRYDANIQVNYKDYHFYKNCPINNKTDLGFLLFSILCSVNYATKFIDRLFLDEIPQKFKIAYLQYYYLCEFILELNATNGTNLFINDALKNRKSRNCLAHYGLGQYLSENELHPDDPLKGLTQKSFNLDYYGTKTLLYSFLTELTDQIKMLVRLNSNLTEIG